MEDVAEALCTCMVAGRWADLLAAVEAYAARLQIDPTVLFHGALAHRLVGHALVLTHCETFRTCVASVAIEVGRAAPARSLADAVDRYRREFEHLAAFEAFERLTVDELTAGRGTH